MKQRRMSLFAEWCQNSNYILMEHFRCQAWGNLGLTYPKTARNSMIRLGLFPTPFNLLCLSGSLRACPIPSLYLTYFDLQDPCRRILGRNKKRGSQRLPLFKPALNLLLLKSVRSVRRSRCTGRVVTNHARFVDVETASARRRRLPHSRPRKLRFRNEAARASRIGELIAALVAA